jgi:hypothetical protein
MRHSTQTSSVTFDLQEALTPHRPSLRDIVRSQQGAMLLTAGRLMDPGASLSSVLLCILMDKVGIIQGNSLVS